jgi:hypothetical protein
VTGRHPPWGSAKRRELARAIRRAGHAVTPTQLANELHRRVSNIAPALADLADAGLLQAVAPPPRPPRTRGHWPKVSYVLTEAGEKALRDADDDTPPRTARPTHPQAGPDDPSPDAAGTLAGDEPVGRTVIPPPVPCGVLTAGAQLVMADATTAALPELFHLLSEPDALGGAAWTSLLDGDTQEYTIAFTGPHATRDALDLMSRLAGARINARRVVVSDVSTADELAEAMITRSDAARRSRLARDTREAS